MVNKIFINLAVNNVDISEAFYIALGFIINPEFSGDNQRCMVWSEHIYVMLQSQEMFRHHIKKAIPNKDLYQTASYTLPVESTERVNEFIENGIRAGGIEPIPIIDEGYMKVRTIQDFDGHTWSVIFLDMHKFKNR